MEFLPLFIFIGSCQIITSCLSYRIFSNNRRVKNAFEKLIAFGDY